MEARFTNSMRFFGKRTAVFEGLAIDYQDYDMNQADAIGLGNQETAETCTVHPNRLTVDFGRPTDTDTFMQRVQTASAVVADLMGVGRTTRIGVRQHWVIDANRKKAFSFVKEQFLGDVFRFGQPEFADVSITLKSTEVRFHNLSFTVRALPAIQQDLKLVGTTPPEPRSREVLLLDVDVFAENFPLTSAGQVAKDSLELVQSVILPKLGG